MPSDLQTFLHSASIALPGILPIGSLCTAAQRTRRTLPCQCAASCGIPPVTKLLTSCLFASTLSTLTTCHVHALTRALYRRQVPRLTVDFNADAPGSLDTMLTMCADSNIERVLERELAEGQSWAPNASGRGTGATGGTQIAGWNLDALKRVV